MKPTQELTKETTMTVPRYNHPSCGQPGVNPDTFIYETTITEDNKAAMEMCLGCPDRFTCLKDLLNNPAGFDKQIRAAIPVSRDIIKKLLTPDPGKPYPLV